MAGRSFSADLKLPGALQRLRFLFRLTLERALKLLRRDDGSCQRVGKDQERRLRLPPSARQVDPQKSDKFTPDENQAMEWLVDDDQDPDDDA